VVARPAVRARRARGSSSSSGGDLADSLTKADISAGVAKIQSKASACGAKSSAKGKVKVSVKVAANGTVASVSVKESPDPALGSCVAAAMQKATFAKTKNGGSFSYPFRF
jgi:TonB family protein